MIVNKTVFIAHGWSEASLNLQSKALAEALSADNRVVFLNSKKSGIAFRQINENLFIYEWPGKRPTGLKDFLFAWKLFRRFRPDIIVTNFAANDIMLFVSYLTGVKIRVCYYHTLVQQHIADFQKLGIKQRINIFRKGIAFRLATHMLPSTRAAKTDLLHYYKVKPNKAYIFPNALPDTTIRNSVQNLTIGYLGRLDRSKGVDILIEAFAIVLQHFPSAFLTIAGKGKLEQELHQKTSLLGIADKVDFKGLIPYKEILSYLSSVYFVVVPSRMDNLPTVVLESLSVATPVIGSTAGGIPDMINHLENGLLFESENVNDLAEKMLHLFKHEKVRNRLSKQARKDFEAKYALFKHRERFELLLQPYTN